MKKLFITLVAFTVLATSCTERMKQARERNLQFAERKYKIVLYSGGKPVYFDNFTGYINQEDSSDGVFYFKGDTLVEVNGDYVITSLSK